MKEFFIKLQNYLVLRFNSVTIRQANIVTTLVILLFTIVFAYLLIKENYHDYEITLSQQHHEQMAGTPYNYDVAQEKLKSLLIKNTLAIATLAFILFAIMLGFYKIFNTLLQRDMESFLIFFKDAAHNDQVINPNTILFKEFKTMGTHVNEMVDTINEQKRTLRELNLHLEDKVKAKTQDLERILDAQKEFLRYTVHETNTPLSVILTSLELYEMKYEKDRHLAKVEAAAKNIFNIYDDLSYLVKKEHINYPKVSIDINKFIKSRIDFFSEVANLSSVSFSFHSEVEGAYIFFNKTKLQRIIDNSITNAIKYTYRNEVVDVKLTKTMHEVEFSIGSKSQPIKNIDKIFDEYYRGEDEQTSKIEGFGIGLRLVKNICDEEGVKISLDRSDEKNTFIYRFTIMGE
ncbi:HAMP domain-containing sensor histidine kinase [Sulfurimonas sp. C5]|uniref:sensor histidine kinase n=1 Tax=Sulfurimonas sp. C5 TaxID=3036947 RepID=UPI0024585864|nr:HAMP domain-containing sensor histidine kinase [Sulfurimonas sp. C5]MDH4943510.1 HAMP domain-containing sensor histidine kinase [Sulfurimonas sp. C5]